MNPRLLTCTINIVFSWVPPELKGRVPYRPMVHLEAQTTGNDWKFVEESNQPIIMFFNEPERAGISPAHAADIWHRQMVPLRQQKGKKLVSPSCSNDGAGQAWMADFMNRVKDSPPDLLGLHYYGTDANDAIKYLTDMHNKHGNMKVMVTEIASIARDHNSVLHFTAQFANWADHCDWILEYAFFGCMKRMADNFVSPAAQLMNPDGSFTDLQYKLMFDQPIKG